MKYTVTIERVIKETYEVEYESDSIMVAFDAARLMTESLNQISESQNLKTRNYVTKVTTKEPESK